MKNILSRKKKKRIFLVPEDTVLVLQALVCLRFHHLEGEACLSVQQQKKVSQKLGMLYVRCIFCDDNFIDIAFKGKGGGAGNPATHFHQQQPIILLKNRLFCVHSASF